MSFVTERDCRKLPEIAKMSQFVAKILLKNKNKNKNKINK
jgi:hypothetical protein